MIADSTAFWFVAASYAIGAVLYVGAYAKIYCDMKRLRQNEKVLQSTSHSR